MNHKIKPLLAAVALAALTLSESVLAQGTAFTYQGRLNDGANPASGSYDLRFTIYDALTNGSAIAGPLTNSPIAVSNGLFTVTLDFGNPFPGAARWLEIAARTNGGGAFSALSPRQALTPTPYAIYSANAGSAASATTAGSANSVAAANITGTIPLAQLPGSVVTNGASGVNVSGTFSGNGAGMTNVDLFYVNSHGAITSLNFVLSSSPTVGNEPLSVVAADVNGDGKLDLISANYLANTLSVLTNNGAGGFVLASSPAVGNLPFSVVAADINGDGKVDLISANSSADTLSVLTNNGSGGFVLASSPGVGNNPVSVVAADVNGDGKVDLISANYVANTLSVLTNNGSGGFGSNATYAVGSGPWSVVAADVNGDGKVDLVSANFGDNTLSVLTNNGSGGFVLAASLAVGNAPDSVAVVDVNGDGKVDLICANAHASTLSVLTNDGSGGFAPASSVFAGSGPYSVVAADLNGDGKVDLITANYNGNTLSVLTNNGSGGFALASSPAVGSGPFSVVAADLNGDGRVDLVSANSNTNTLSVLFNTLKFSGTFTGNGGGLTNLNAASVTGTLGTAQIPNLDASKITSGTLGSARIPNLDASKITSGTLADAQLSSNVARLNADQTFTGQNTFSNAVVVSGAVTATNFNGSGSGLTNLPAGNLTGSVPSGTLTSVPAGNLTGSVPAASLTSVPATNLTGSVPAASLTSVPAGNLTGTVLDGRLSANVALRGATNTFLSRHDQPQKFVSSGASDPPAINIVGPDGVSVQAYTLTIGVDIFSILSSVSANGDAVILAPSGHKLLLQTSSGTVGIALDSSNNVGIAQIPSGTYKLEVNGTAHRADNSANWTVASDRRYKRDITPLTNSLAVLEQLRPSRFRYNEDYVREHPATTDKERVGFVAQEFEQVFPDYVTRNAEGYLSVDISPVTFHNTEAIRELNQKLEQKETEITELKARLEKLERLMNKERAK